MLVEITHCLVGCCQKSVIFRLVLRQWEKFLSAVCSVEENYETQAITYINVL
jgi:hypothetical protein